MKAIRILALGASLLAGGIASAQGELTTYTPVVKYVVNKQPEYLPGKYAISIKANGLKDTNLYLFSYYSDKNLPMDTVKLNKKGMGVFDGNFRLPRGMYVVVIRGLDPGSGKSGFFKMFEFAMADDQEFGIEFDTSSSEDYYGKMKITGNDELQRFVDYSRFIRTQSILQYELSKKLEAAKNAKDERSTLALTAQMKLVDSTVNSYKDKQIKMFPNDYLSTLFLAMDEPELPKVLPKGPDGKDDSSYLFTWYKAHYWDNIRFQDDGIVRSPEAMFKRRLDRYMDRIAYQDPDSLAVECDMLINRAKGARETEKFLIWYLTNKYQTSQIMGQDAVYVHMAQKYYCTGRAWWADSGIVKGICESAERLEHTLVGRQAPDLLMADSAGRYYRLYDLKADYTFVIFWDPTCSHCQKAVPMLADIVKRNAEKGRKWEVYSVSSESKFAEWKPFLRQHPEIKNWVNVCKTELTAPWPINKFNYNIIANPTILILDKDKKVVAKKIDENKIEEFMGYLYKDKDVTPSAE